MVTLSAVVGLWAMARPVDLPRRARLAVNGTIAMAGAQVIIFVLRKNEYSNRPTTPTTKVIF